MKKVFYPIAALILALALAMPLATVVLAAPMSGSIWTTDSSGSSVDQNIYDYRGSVYLNGGPASEGAKGLPDGDYYVMVTSPNGEVLGKSNPAQPVHVVDGRFATLYWLWQIVKKASSGFTAPGYDITPNHGGEYKVWISQDPTFHNNASKTDNFKVRHPCD